MQTFGNNPTQIILSLFSFSVQYVFSKKPERIIYFVSSSEYPWQWSISCNRKINNNITRPIRSNKTIWIMGYLGDLIIVRKLNKHGTITIIAAIIFDFLLYSSAVKPVTSVSGNEMWFFDLTANTIFFME